MAKGFKHGSGGSNPLSFKVIAYATEEALMSATAKENTIGVITGDEITSWIFSATEPAEPMEGMVWFYTGASSNVEFNALKKNAIQIYPISVKQCAGGAWVEKTAKSYLGGAWIDWATYLYKLGDKCVDITGGWLASKTSDGNGMVPSITINVPYMSLAANGDSANGVVYTANKIDVSKYSKLKCKHGAIQKGNGLYFGVLDDSFKYLGSMPAYVDIPTSNTETVVDISNLQGLYRIGFILRSSGSVRTVYINDITSITLE